MLSYFLSSRNYPIQQVATSSSKSERTTYISVQKDVTSSFYFEFACCEKGLLLVLCHRVNSVADWIEGAEVGGQQLAGYFSSGSLQAEMDYKHNGWFLCRFELVISQKTPYLWARFLTLSSCICSWRYCANIRKSSRLLQFIYVVFYDMLVPTSLQP